LGVATKETEEHLREICLSFPEVTEKLSHGTPSFFARKQFASLWMGGHHERDYAHLTCAAPEGAQEILIASDPEVYFRPPYVGHRGWIGVRLDVRADFDAIEEILEDAYRCVASKRQIAAWDASRNNSG
jgi:hypothetical protein